MVAMYNVKECYLLYRKIILLDSGMEKTNYLCTKVNRCRDRSTKTFYVLSFYGVCLNFRV